MDPRDIIESVKPEEVVAELSKGIDVKSIVEAGTAVEKEVEEIIVATLNIKTVEDVLKVEKEVEEVVQKCSTMGLIRTLLQNLSQLLSRRTVPLKSE